MNQELLKERYDAAIALIHAQDSLAHAQRWPQLFTPAERAQMADAVRQSTAVWRALGGLQ